MNSRYDWSCPYVLRWGYDHRRAMRGAPAAAARVAEADFDGLFSYYAIKFAACDNITYSSKLT